MSTKNFGTVGVDQVESAGRDPTRVLTKPRAPKGREKIMRKKFSGKLCACTMSVVNERRGTFTGHCALTHEGLGHGKLGRVSSQA